MDELEARLTALERAVTDGDHDLSELAVDGEIAERLASVETQSEEMADRVAELEAATQALRGYVGNVRAVNRDVEKRADFALSKVEALDSQLRTEQQTDHMAKSFTNERQSPNCKKHTPVQTDAHNGVLKENHERSADSGEPAAGVTADESRTHGYCPTCKRRHQPDKTHNGEYSTDATAGSQQATSPTESGQPLDVDRVFEPTDQPDEKGTFERIRSML